jgi:ZIP family zinc transporter
VELLAGNWAGIDPHQFRILLPIFVGTFLYLGMADLIPESHHAHPKIWTTLATVAGMAVIYGVTTLGE